MNTYGYIYVYIYVYTCIHTYIPTYLPACRQTYLPTYRQTDRQTDIGGGCLDFTAHGPRSARRIFPSQGRHFRQKLSPDEPCSLGPQAGFSHHNPLGVSGGQSQSAKTTLQSCGWVLNSAAALEKLTIKSPRLQFKPQLYPDYRRQNEEIATEGIQKTREPT